MTSLVLVSAVVTGWLWLLAAQALLFAWGAFAGPGRGPWALVYRRVVRPRLGPPDFWEDASGPRFAQLVGLVVTGVGLGLAVLQVPHAALVAASVALAAALLNGVFGVCLGCWMYRLLLRVRPRRPVVEAGAGLAGP
jgi:hypothetical protein